jgi:hypothetical protein
MAEKFSFEKSKFAYFLKNKLNFFNKNKFEIFYFKYIYY